MYNPDCVIKSQSPLNKCFSMKKQNGSWKQNCPFLQECRKVFKWINKSILVLSFFHECDRYIIVAVAISKVINLLLNDSPSRNKMPFYYNLKYLRGEIFPNVHFSSRISQFLAKIQFSHPSVDGGKKGRVYFSIFKKGRAWRPLKNLKHEHFSLLIFQLKKCWISWKRSCLNSITLLLKFRKFSIKSICVLDKQSLFSMVFFILKLKAWEWKVLFFLCFGIFTCTILWEKLQCI